VQKIDGLFSIRSDYAHLPELNDGRILRIMREYKSGETGLLNSVQFKILFEEVFRGGLSMVQVL
jgi:hypothetical protein